MKERLWFVGGAVTALLLVMVLTTLAWSLGRTELYGAVLEWRLQSDSTAKACSR